jgi:hypothetical protein
MTSEAKKTGLFAGVAALLVLLAVVSMPRASVPAPFNDQNEEFYPAFKDPLKAAALEVIDYDDLAGTPKPFKVQVVDGHWSIPSHHNYPADGKDRLAKTAASVMDLRKERSASENPKLHEEFGVVDPLDPNAKGTKGRGKRVRLFDAAGSILADYIFGKETQEGSGHRYVRIPDQKRTYAIKVALDISVKFEDWVETDLLQLSSGAIRKVVIDKYSFDEDQQTLKDRSTHFLVHDDASGPWKVSELKDTEEVNTETVNTLTSTLSGLKLAGVRPKPRLVAAAKDLSELGKLPQQALMVLAQELSQRGYFIFREGKTGFAIVSNEGEMQVSCDDGVVYTLRFGEVLVGSGEEISAGKDEAKKDPKDKKDEKKDEKKDDKKAGSENRYLFVSVRYDESLVKPPVEPKPYVADPAKKPEEQKAEEEKAKKEKEEYETKKKDFEKKKEDGKKRAEKLTARFAQWYYVISADAFKKLRVDRAQLVKAKEVPKEEKKPEDKKGDEKKAEEKKPEDKKPDETKPEDKKPDKKPSGDKPPTNEKANDKKPDEKKAEEKPKPPDEKKP